MASVEISVSPRIHCGLISMHASPPRKNGGIGFSVSGPECSVEIGASEGLVLEDHRRAPLGTKEQAKLLETLAQVAEQLNLRHLVSVRISGSMATHMGMGSGTAIRLACIEGLASVNGVALEKDELISLSGRGGTSGIGINTYFGGGFVMDLGHVNDGENSAPSSRVVAPSMPLTLPTLEMPDWPMLLCLPRSMPPKSQDEEAAFFDRILPLDEASSFHASYVALFQVYASALAGDYASFCNGISAMQNAEWKRLEIEEYGDSMRSLMRRILELGADCVGMSSLGPMLYCFGQGRTLEEISRAASELDCDVFMARPNNSGRRLGFIE